MRTYQWENNRNNLILKMLMMEYMWNLKRVGYNRKTRCSVPIIMSREIKWSYQCVFGKWQHQTKSNCKTKQTLFLSNIIQTSVEQVIQHIKLRHSNPGICFHIYVPSHSHDCRPWSTFVLQQHCFDFHIFVCTLYLLPQLYFHSLTL